MTIKILKGDCSKIFQGKQLIVNGQKGELNK